MSLSQEDMSFLNSDEYLGSIAPVRERVDIEEETPVIEPPTYSLPTMRAMIEGRIEDVVLESKAPPTGYADLDACYRPLVPGRLCTLTGDTNSGKTAFACNMAHRLIEQKRRVIYFALEPDRALTDYFASIKFRKPFEQITDADREGCDNSYLHPYVTDKKKGTREVESFAGMLSIVRRAPRVDLIIVDHIGYFTDSKSNNFYAEQGRVLKELALLAQEKMTHIMVIAHLNKSFKATEDDWIPTMNQISGSASFKQDSDDVLMLARKPIRDDYGVFHADSGVEGVVVVGKSKSARGKHVCPLNFHLGTALITGRNEDLNPREVMEAILCP